MNSKTTRITPAKLNLPTGEYQISITERAIRDKWGLPLVYTFYKWSDNALTPNRRIRLEADLELCAQFKIAHRASFELWTRILLVIIASELNRFNELYRKYPALFG